MKTFYKIKIEKFNHINNIFLKYCNYQIDEPKLGGKDIQANVIHEIDVIQDIQMEVETITVCLLYKNKYKK